MKVAGIRELRQHSAALLGGPEPLLVTRHGKIFGLYLPLGESDRVPDDLRRTLAASIGAYLSRRLEADGVSEKDVLRDFDEYRRSRR